MLENDSDSEVDDVDDDDDDDDDDNQTCRAEDVGQASSAYNTTSSLPSQWNIVSAQVTETLSVDEIVNEHANEQNRFETEDSVLGKCVLECSSESQCNAETVVLHNDNANLHKQTPDSERPANRNEAASLRYRRKRRQFKKKYRDQLERLTAEGKHNQQVLQTGTRTVGSSKQQQESTGSGVRRKNMSASSETTFVSKLNKTHDVSAKSTNSQPQKSNHARSLSKYLPCKNCGCFILRSAMWLHRRCFDWTYRNAKKKKSDIHAAHSHNAAKGGSSSMACDSLLKKKDADNNVDDVMSKVKCVRQDNSINVNGVCNITHGTTHGTHYPLDVIVNDQEYTASSDNVGLRYMDLESNSSSMSLSQAITICQDSRENSYCYFCCQPQSDIQHHLKSVHSKEKAVIQLASAATDKARVRSLMKLRNRGNHRHNQKVLQDGRGTLTVLHYPNAEAKLGDYSPCRGCWNYMTKAQLSQHRCELSLQKSGNSKCRQRVKFLLPPPPAITREDTVI